MICLLYEKVLPLLQFPLSSKVNITLMLSRIWAVTTILLSWEMEFWWILLELVTDQSSTHHCTQSLYNAMIPEEKWGTAWGPEEQNSTNPHALHWIFCKAASKSFACLRKGESAQIPFKQHNDLFQMAAQKSLEDIWHDSKLITIKVCS